MKDIPHPIGNQKRPALRIAFAGTPKFASVCLQAILAESEHEVCLVLTQPDRPSGRGRKLRASPVKQLALEHDLGVQQPPSLRDDDDLAALRAANIDLLVVAAYGLLLPPDVLAIPRLTCINVHASLLPHWRGAAPIERAILAGDTETGISIMEMAETLDTGPVYAQAKCPIAGEDTAATLTDKLAGLGAQCLLATIGELVNGSAVATAQNDARASYANKIDKAEVRLDWTEPAPVSERKVRAFNPRPVAVARLFGRDFKIWQAHAIDGPDAGLAPGSIAAAGNDGIDVNTSLGRLRITGLQAPGKKLVSARDFINGNRELLQSTT